MRLRCTASAAAHPDHEEISLPHAPHVRAIVSRDLGLIYAGGIGASQTNATDALAQLDALLQVANSSLTLTTNCRFFLRDGSTMQDFFGGFYQAFNKEHPPPPARTEYAGVTSDLKCAGHAGNAGAAAAACAVLVKCEAATAL